MKELADIFDEAADLIERDGWWDGVTDAAVVLAGGPLRCVTMALDTVVRGVNLARPWDALVEFLGLSYPEALPEWNDAHDAEYVILNLRKAAEGVRNR